MNRSSKLLRLGTPLMLGVLILVIAIARVGADDADEPTDQVDPGDEYQVEEVTIESIEVLLAESYPVQVFVEAVGYVPDPCWEPQEPVVEQDGQRFNVEIVAERKADEMCPQVIADYSTNIALGSPGPGQYIVVVNGVEQEFEVH